MRVVLLHTCPIDLILVGWTFWETGLVRSTDGEKRLTIETDGRMA